MAPASAAPMEHQPLLDDKRSVSRSTSASSLQVDRKTLLDLEAVPEEDPQWSSRLGQVLCALSGPGMMVSLADTDGSCLIVAAQSGMKYGYGLLLLQVLLVPVLFLAQELTVRLGVHTRKGHTACILHQFGFYPAALSLGVLLASCTGAVIAELSTITATGQLFGWHRVPCVAGAVAILVLLIVTQNYRRIEIFAVLLGLFELVFVVAMFMAKPDGRELMHGLGSLPLDDPDYRWLFAANIGAVVMPWMIYFQQSAIVARKLRSEAEETHERVDTAVGTVLTQLIMIGTLVTMAATRTMFPKLTEIRHVEDMVSVLSHVFGNDAVARGMLAAAFLGGSLCAAIVVTLAASWGVSELCGEQDANSMELQIRERPYFYGTYVVIIVLASLVVCMDVSIIRLNVLITLIDALLMPVTLFCLYKIATNEELPERVRVQGPHRAVCFVAFSVCSACAVACAVSSMAGWGGD